MRRFSKRRAKDRIHAAPEQLTPQEVEFYLGVSPRTVRYWLQEIANSGLPVAELMGDRWTVHKDLLINWLIMTKRIKFSSQYGYPTPEQAMEIFDRIMLAPPLTRRLRLVAPKKE
jgi:hypothetical protein